jgi:hypothetical protein
VLGACGSDDANESTLKFSEGSQRQTPSVDAPPVSPQGNEITAGDRVVATKELFDVSGEERKGSIYLDCVAATGGENARILCSGVTVLEDGTISFAESVLFSDEGARSAAITGGTDAYEGATGSIAGGVDGGKVDEFHLFLP